MSYTKTTWSENDIITADKLNNIEEGVSQSNSVYEIENEKFLTYFKTGGGYGNMQICKITFVFYKERLDNWRYEGNMCDAYIDSIDLH